MSPSYHGTLAFAPRKCDIKSCTRIRVLGTHSDDYSSGYASPDSSPPTRPLRDWLVDIDDIPLTSLDKDKRPYTLHDDTTDDDDDDEIVEKERLKATRRKSSDDNMEEARRLIKTLTNGHNHLSKWQEPPPRLVQPQASIWLWICH
jgi:hypothetical protein